jgi:hypothetical protein
MVLAEVDLLIAVDEVDPSIAVGVDSNEVLIIGANLSEMGTLYHETKPKDKF